MFLRLTLFAGNLLDLTIGEAPDDEDEPDQSLRPPLGFAGAGPGITERAEPYDEGMTGEDE